MGKCYLRVILCHFFHDLSPQSGRIQYIRLIYAADLFISLHCDIKSSLCDPADLIFIICKRIGSSSYPVYFFCLSCAEVQSSGQFSHDQHIKSGCTDILTKRTCTAKLIIEISRSQICKQVQSFSDSQQSCLRTSGRLQLIPWRSLCITANGTHQHCITFLCLFYSIFGQRHTMYINGCSSQEKISIIELMSVFFTHRVQYLAGFSYDLRANSITGNHSNLIIHLMSPLLHGP